MRIFDHRRPKTMAAECGGNYDNLAKRREGVSFFPKAQKQEKRLSGVVAVTIHSANLGGRRQMRVHWRRLIGILTEFIFIFLPNAKTHRRCAAECIRYAWHRRTPKARMLHWGRRRRIKMCVDNGMASGRTDDSLLFQKSLEFCWRESCVIIYWNAFLDVRTSRVVMLGFVLVLWSSVYGQLTATDNFHMKHNKNI